VATSWRAGTVTRDWKTRVREGLEDLYTVVVLFGGSLLLLWLTRC